MIFQEAASGCQPLPARRSIKVIKYYNIQNIILRQSMRIVLFGRSSHTLFGRSFTVHKTNNNNDEVILSNITKHNSAQTRHILRTNKFGLNLVKHANGHPIKSDRSLTTKCFVLYCKTFKLPFSHEICRIWKVCVKMQGDLC